MPVEVLVMCEKCGRPQKANGRACVTCGAALPESAPARNTATSGRDRLLEQYTPFFEGDLGRGRKLLLSEKRFEWVVPKGGFTTELADLKGAHLAQRPVYEALLFCVLSAGVIPFAGTPVRVALSVLFILGLLACFLQRRYVLVLERRDQRFARLLWGIGRPSSPLGQRARSVYASLAQQLRARGVEVAP